MIFKNNNTMQISSNFWSLIAGNDVTTTHPGIKYLKNNLLGFCIENEQKINKDEERNKHLDRNAFHNE